MSTPPAVDIAENDCSFTSVVNVMVEVNVEVLLLRIGSCCVAVTVAVLLTNAGTPATT
jgi:hypothetical protein